MRVAEVKLDAMLPEVRLSSLSMSLKERSQARTKLRTPLGRSFSPQASTSELEESRGVMESLRNVMLFSLEGLAPSSAWPERLKCVRMLYCDALSLEFFGYFSIIFHIFRMYLVSPSASDRPRM